MIKLGIIIGNRGFFPAHLCDTGRKEILATLEKLGIGVVTLPTERTRFGAVESLEDAQKCADLFKQNAGKIDGILVTLPNFGDERGVANALRWSGLRVPVLVHAFNDDPKTMTIQDRRDSVLRQDVGLQQPSPIQHSLHPDPTAYLHSGQQKFRAGFAGFRRDLPRGQGAEKSAHRRAGRPAHGVQHRPLQRKIARTIRHQHRNARFI